MKKTVLFSLCIFVVVTAVWMSGCSMTQAMFAKQGSFEIIKVNRHLHMQNFRGQGFEQAGKKHEDAGETTAANLLWDEQGEEFIVIWRYNGPVISDAPVTLHFDYNYLNDSSFYRVSEQYDTVVPGRHEFRFQNFGDN